MKASFASTLSIVLLLSIWSVESACPFTGLTSDTEGYDAEAIAAAHASHPAFKNNAGVKTKPKARKNKTRELKESKKESKKAKPGKGYFKFKKWMEENFGIVAPKNHFLFWVFEGNCKPYEGEYSDDEDEDPIDTLECGYYSWDGTYIGPSYALCKRLDTGMLACDAHRTVTGNVTSPDHDPNHPALGNYIKISNVLQQSVGSGGYAFRSVVTGGTGAFMGISGEIVYMVEMAEPTIMYPQVLIASGPYVKDLAFYEYSDFNEEDVVMPPPMSEWFQNVTGMYMDYGDEYEM